MMSELREIFKPGFGVPFPGPRESGAEGIEVHQVDHAGCVEETHLTKSRVFLVRSENAPAFLRRWIHEKGLKEEKG